MPIAIIGSGYDTFMTLGLLSHTKQQFLCIVDSKYGPREQKSRPLVAERVQASIDYAVSLGATKIILPPIYELIYKDNPMVIPLYQNYLLRYVLPHSRVGKLGVLGNHSDTIYIQSVLSDFSHIYTLSEPQKATKKFQSPFSRWTKDVSIWGDFLRRAKSSNWMIRKYIKNDLRFFVDAAVDTLIPTSYTHFYRETILRHHCNFKKTRRQQQSYIRDIATELLGVGDGFDCKIFANDDISGMLESYPWKGFICKGEDNKREIIYKDW